MHHYSKRMTNMQFLLSSKTSLNFWKCSFTSKEILPFIYLLWHWPVCGRISFHSAPTVLKHHDYGSTFQFVLPEGQLTVSASFSKQKHWAQTHCHFWVEQCLWRRLDRFLKQYKLKLSSCIVCVWIKHLVCLVLCYRVILEDLASQNNLFTECACVLYIKFRFFLRVNVPSRVCMCACCVKTEEVRGDRWLVVWPAAACLPKIRQKQALHSDWLDSPK